MKPETVWVKVITEDGSRWTLYENKVYRTKEEAINSAGPALPYVFLELALVPDTSLKKEKAWTDLSLYDRMKMMEIEARQKEIKDAYELPGEAD